MLWGWGFRTDEMAKAYPQASLSGVNPVLSRYRSGLRDIRYLSRNIRIKTGWMVLESPCVSGRLGAHGSIISIGLPGGRC